MKFSLPKSVTTTNNTHTDLLFRPFAQVRKLCLTLSEHSIVFVIVALVIFMSRLHGILIHVNSSSAEYL